METKPNASISIHISRLYWKDERVKHNMTTSLLHPLPKDPSEHPGYGPKSANKSYVLINDAEDIKMMWKPDVFIDQAVKIRSGKSVEIGWSSF